MGSALLITLREGLEAALIVAIVLAYLKRLERESDFRTIWIGAGAAMGLAVIAGAIVFGVVGELEGNAEAITEGVVAFVATGVLTWMIFWMAKQARFIKGALQSKVDDAIAAGSAVALAGIAFVAILREGLETSLFLLSAGVGTEANAGHLFGGFIGLGVASGIGYLVYKGSHRVNLRVFFRVTGVLILLFAAGLLAKGVHEFQEANLIGTVNEHVFDVSSVAALDPSATTSGEFLKGLFGWSPAPSAEMLLVYIAFLVPVGAGFLALTRKVPAVRQVAPVEVASAA